MLCKSATAIPQTEVAQIGRSLTKALNTAMTSGKSVTAHSKTRAFLPLGEVDKSPEGALPK